MKRLFNILVFLLLTSVAFAQEETRVVDSLLSVLPNQEGREKVKTMIELTWDFYDVSFDDCISWGEKAIMEAKDLNQYDLEAEANYTLGVQYAQHADLDLAKQYLYLAYLQYQGIDDSEYIREFGWDFSSTKFAFLSLWNIAFYELAVGNIDTAYLIYEKALPLAERMDDTSSCAYILSNIATIWYNRGDLEKSYDYNVKAKHLFESFGDEQSALRMDASIALLFYEKGRITEAKEMFWRLIPRLEEYGDYYYLLNICHNIGTIYNNELINYDSAMYYLQKAMLYGEMPMCIKDDEMTANREKADVVAEMGNVMLNKGDFKEAVEEYERALEMAERNSYYHGQIMACIGLAKAYAQQGQAIKSLHFFQCLNDLEEVSGISYKQPSVRKYLAIDYARLGRFEDLYAELGGYEDENLILIGENNKLYDQLGTLQSDYAGLLSQYESQINQIETLQSQRNHYRMAFYGLLCLCLAAVVLYIAYKIVRKKRSKV